MKPTNVKCKTCTFAQPVDAAKGTYECRIEPPRAGDGAHGRPFPQVLASDWCRVWMPAEGSIQVPKQQSIIKPVS
jgi:hypothetical protein